MEDSPIPLDKWLTAMWLICNCRNGVSSYEIARDLGGTYIAVEPFHLFRYVDEQAFRFNNRKDDDGNKLTDAERFTALASQIVGKRLTFAEVTGKVQETPF
jgi:hypothetical protein